MAGSGTHNDTAATPRLRVALIARGERLRTLWDAARANPRIEIVGQSGMPQKEALPDIPWHDDHRVLVARPEVEAALLGTSTRGDVAISMVAAQEEVHVWRPPPLARNFAEAAELVKLVRKQGTIHRAASWWEHVTDRGWQELAWPDGFEPQFSELACSTPAPPLEAWQSVANDAGGGALAQDAYALLEALVATRGLPETVSAALSNLPCEPGAAHRETENIALAVLRYANQGVADVRATWGLTPTVRRLVHHATAGSVTLTDHEVVLADPTGQRTDEHPLPPDPLGSDLRRFVDAALSNAADRMGPSLERHLAVMALLDAVYLAARTVHPESPQKHYELQGWPVPRL